MLFKPTLKQQIKNGFTLIEVIIGIVVFAISLAIIVSLILPTDKNSADQIHQIKASALAQALMDDIMSRAFDENSDMAGGAKRCDEDKDGNGSVEPSELCSSVFGPDSGESDRSLYDDVDDFNGYSLQVDAIDDPLDQGYSSFTINVTVSYAGTQLGLSNNRLAKLVAVTVTTPFKTDIEFSVYKANF